MDGGGGWAAGGGLNLLLRLFGLAMGQVPVIGPNTLRGPKRCLTTTRVNFRPMPSM